MTQMDMGYANVNTRAKAKGKMNVYTALMGITALALLLAIIFVMVKYNEFFGSWNAFEVVEPGPASILAPILHLLS
jgi:heme/copper-type cytochrome/quinol oxidase subunit 3